MGYFSNGTEGRAYQDKYCSRCVHDINQNCQVWLAHLIHSRSECNNPNSILNYLIPQSEDGLRNEQCSMFLAREA